MKTNGINFDTVCIQTPLNYGDVTSIVSDTLPYVSIPSVQF